MSLILDALRKADRERQQQQNGVPGLDAAHARAEVPPRRLWPWLVAIAVVVLGLLAAVIWLALERHQAAPVVVQAPEPVSSITKPSAPAQATAANAPTITSASADSLSLEVAPGELDGKTASSVASGSTAAPASKRMAQTAAGQASSDTTQMNTQENLDKPAVDAEVARLYSAPPPDESPETVAPRPAVAPVKVPATASAITDSAATRPAPDDAALRSSLLAAHPNVGTIRDLPLAVQNAIPTLMYAAHEYRQGGASEVTINNQSLREGQTLGDLEVEMIAEDGVILRKGDHQFKLTAMSSWVNM